MREPDAPDAQFPMIEPDAPDAQFPMIEPEQFPMIEPDEPIPDMGRHELPDPDALSDLPDLDEDPDISGIETAPPPDESLVQDTEEDE